MQAVERIFSLLNTIAAHPEGLSLSAISERVGLAKSTTSRFLQSLEQVQAVQRDDNAYTIGVGVMQLASSVPPVQALETLAMPLLLELADKSLESVHLAIREGHRLTYIAQVHSAHRVQLETWLNHSYPLHLTAAGKALLAFAADELIEDYLSQPLQAFTAHSISDPEQLRGELCRIRRQRYAQTVREFSDDISGFAVAIVPDQIAVASISISMPTFRFPEDNGDAIIQLLQEVSQVLSERLKGKPVRPLEVNHV